MHRRVRRLRLACTREDHARHGRVLLEDALRTASFDDARRLIIVRKVDLGRIAYRAPATHWSRRLEESFRATAPALVRFEDPAAAHADAVYFADANEPWLVLALRMAANQPSTEWFWVRAAPSWTPRLGSAATLRLCFHTLAATGGLPLTLQLARRLDARAALTPLLESLERADLSPLATELRNVPQESAVRIESPMAERAFPPLATAEMVLVRKWGPHDPRTLWLAAVHIARTDGIDDAGFSLFAVRPETIRQCVEQWLKPAHAQPAAEKSTGTLRSIAPPPSPQSRREPTVAGAERVFTRAGGLFFAVPLLVRVGLPDFLATLSEEEARVVPWQILRLCLRHARIPEDDPLPAMLESLPPTSQKLGRWLLASNRASLRLTKINLRELIRRPALVTISPTHLEVFFRPGDADVRIRRAALDLDPGWVPWLERAIAFHFNRED